MLLTILNLYLSNRLERYLKVELSQRTAEATDGFYNLTFDDLSIGFVKGELKIEGVRLMPDSTVFQQSYRQPSPYICEGRDRRDRLQRCEPDLALEL